MLLLNSVIKNFPPSPTGVTASGSSAIDDGEESSVSWWSTLDHPNGAHHNHHHDHSSMSTSSSLATTRHHKHYRDPNHHKVRHHHDERSLRRRRYLPNKHQPKFSHSEYQANVAENLPVGSSIMHVSIGKQRFLEELVQLRENETWKQREEKPGFDTRGLDKNLYLSGL